jgi:hypothetical protein
MQKCPIKDGGQIVLPQYPPLKFSRPDEQGKVIGIGVTCLREGLSMSIQSGEFFLG